MIYWGRWLTRLILIALMGLLERVMGLPIVMIILTSLYAGRLNSGWRWGLLLAVSVLGAALFMVPFSISWLVINLSYLWSKHAASILPSKIMRLFLGGLVGSIIIIVVGLGQVYWSQFIYGVGAVLISTIWLKRHRFYLR